MGFLRVAVVQRVWKAQQLKLSAVPRLWARPTRESLGLHTLPLVDGNGGIGLMGIRCFLTMLHVSLSEVADCL